VLVWPEGDELLLGLERGANGRRQQPHARDARSEDLAGHAEVQQQAVAVVEASEQVLADSLEQLEATAAKSAAQLGGGSQEEVARDRRVDARDAAADEQRLELPPRDLDFGELGHGTSG
jgi:hypothetical protein